MRLSLLHLKIAILSAETVCTRLLIAVCCAKNAQEDALIRDDLNIKTLLNVKNFSVSAPQGHLPDDALSAPGITTTQIFPATMKSGMRALRPAYFTIVKMQSISNYGIRRRNLVLPHLPFEPAINLNNPTMTVENNKNLTP